MRNSLTVALGTLLLASPLLADQRQYDLNGFSAIQAQEGVSVVIETGMEFSVQGEAIRGDIDRLRVRQRGDVLVVDRRRGMGLFNSGRRDVFEVTVKMPDLTEVTATSGVSVTVDAHAIDGLIASSASGASLRVFGLNGGDVSAQSSSGASLNIDGTCTSIDARSSSGASLNAQELTCETADIRASSGASLSAHASETAQAHASSGGSIRLSGQPQMTSQNVSSGGSVYLQ
ncbi:head GIN domain-containing protein [Aestuariibius sp. HNIBRBA575]|uniref:head GIN domain-containing protein n=1 Tax=Aestuariibius sp. HNIBRBA575 TaxID=3233343 RepID=UPI0034A3098D